MGTDYDEVDVFLVRKIKNAFGDIAFQQIKVIVLAFDTGVGILQLDFESL